MKLGFEESQSSYSSGSQSARAWTEAWVSAWAYCPHCGNAKIVIPQQQSTRGFLLYVLQRRVRVKEPEGQIRNEGCRRRVQDEMRASGRQQQSKPVSDELRSQVACGR